MPGEESGTRAGARTAGSCLLLVFVNLLLIYLEVGGIAYAFARHGVGTGIAAVLIPPLAWWHAVTGPFEQPKRPLGSAEHLQPPTSTRTDTPAASSIARGKGDAAWKEEELLLAVIAATHPETDEARAKVLSATVPRLILAFRDVDEPSRRTLRTQLTAFIDVFTSGWGRVSLAALSRPPTPLSIDAILKDYGSQIALFSANPRMTPVFEKARSKWESEYEMLCKVAEYKSLHNPDELVALRDAVKQEMHTGVERARKVIDDVLGAPR